MRALRLIPLLGLGVTPIAAQSIGAHVGMTRVGDGEYGTLPGFGIRIEQPLGTPRLQWHLAFDAALGTHRFTGIPCAGLIPPGSTTCTSQPLRQTTDMEAGRLGLRLALLQSKRASLSVLGDLGIARLGTTTRDASDTPRLKNWRMVYRREAGVELRVRPRREKAWFLSAGAAVGSVMPVRQYAIADGYSPFDATLALRRYWIGVMVPVQPPSPRRRTR